MLFVVFASAVAGKVSSVRGFEDFRDSIVLLIRPGRWAGRAAEALANGLALAVVLAEVVAVVLLVVPGMRPAGYVLSGLLLAVFAAGIVVAMRSKRRIRCRCFGSGGSVLGRQHLIRNVVLIMIAALGWAVAPTPGGAPQEVLVALVAGGLLGLLVTRWDDVMFVLSGRVRPAVSGRER
jgi:hypothetical protein